jgi:hypothetical protein
MLGGLTEDLILSKDREEGVGSIKRTQGWWIRQENIDVIRKFAEVKIFFDIGRRGLKVGLRRNAQQVALGKSLQTVTNGYGDWSTTGCAALFQSS